MDSKIWRSTREEQEKEIIRRKWHFEQHSLKKHEERKARCIAEYDREYYKAMKINREQCRNNSPQRRDTGLPNYEHSNKLKSEIDNGAEGIIIDEKELHKIKVNVKTNGPTKNQSTSNKIQRDIINPDDIILPQRSNAGSYPMFKGNKINVVKETRTTTRISKAESEKQLSTSRKNAYRRTYRSSDDEIQHHCYSRSYKSTARRTDDDNDRNNRDRSSRVKDSKEEDRDGNERRYVRRHDRSFSRYNGRSTPVRNQSRSRYRSPSPTSEARRGRIDDDKRNFSSGRNNRPREENHASSRSTNYPFLYNFRNNSYMRLSRPMHVPISIPMLMPRGPARPILMPVYSGSFPAPFPQVFRWQKPLHKFGSGRGTRTPY